MELLMLRGAELDVNSGSILTPATVREQPSQASVHTWVALQKVTGYI